MTNPAKRITISSIRPTVFFIRENDELKQMVDICTSNAERAGGLSLKLTYGGVEFDVSLGDFEPGERVTRVPIPDIRESVPVKFSLYAGGELQDETEMQWKPGKHWTTYLVQVSHHDLGYTDLPSNILSEYETIFDDILAYCRETDDWPEDAKFRYTVEQAWSILHYFESRPPEVLDEMVRRIKEGRIEVTALIGNQTSEIHGPEEIVRALYPAFRLKQEFGIPITTAELNDVPGVSWGLATALAGAGIKYFAPGLPSYFDWGFHVHTFWDEKAVLPNGDPDAFWWEAQDGEKVLFWYGGQGAGGTSDPLLPHLAEYLEKTEARGYAYDSIRYWVQGGWRDNAPPIIDFAGTARTWNQMWAFPRVVCGTSAMFFEDLAAQVGPETRTYRGELPGTDYPIGALSTTHETALNRVTHDALLAAERFAVVASEVSEYPYPADTLNEAYDCALLYDEHTWAQADPSGPAEGGDLAQKLEFAYRAAALAQDISFKALNKIVDEVALCEQGHHIIAFNPLPQERTGLVHVEFRPSHPCSRPMLGQTRNDGREGPGENVNTNIIGRQLVELPYELHEGKFRLVDVETGQEVPFQIKQLSGFRDLVPYAAEQWGLGQTDRRRLYSIEFLAEKIPAMGYRSYRVVPTDAAPEFPNGVNIGDAVIENRFYKVTLDPATGTVVSIMDKEIGRELVDADAPHRLNQVIVRSAQTHEEYPIESVTVSKGTSGPLSGSLRITGSVNGCPQITQEITLYTDVKRIDLATRLLKDSTPLQEVYVAFPFKAAKPEFKFESALTVMEPTVDQFPGSNTDYYAANHWANVSDGGESITLVSRDSAMLEFGGLWPGYVSQAHHCVPTPEFGHEFLKPGSLEKGWMYSYVLNGNFQTNFRPVQVSDTLFRYSITSGKGGWKDGRAKDFGYSACLPIDSTPMIGPKDGNLPPAYSFCRVEQPNLVLLTLKRAEDGDGLILRLWETEGRDTEAVVHLPFLKIEEAWQTNLVEENQWSLPLRDDAVTIPTKAWGVSTVRLRI